ncbi:dienelactone hydrolase family protein [Winogradskya humida]|nr:dienelactone hydrolase family protein [Actinoplanes humidus]
MRITETIQIPVQGSTPMPAYVARPAAPGSAPAVLVGMELFGVSAHVRDVCEQLADLGYYAVAPDFYHREPSTGELPADAEGRARGFDMLGRLTREQALADVGATLTQLRNAGHHVAGMVGLSVGGHLAYLSATAFHLPAVAVFYGGWLPTTDIPLSRPQPTLDRTSAITSRVLMLLGADDPLIPAEQRKQIAEALSVAGVAHELVEYSGAGHGFFCRQRDSYEPVAAADAWGRVCRMLHESGVNTTLHAV